MDCRPPKVGAEIQAEIPLPPAIVFGYSLHCVVVAVEGATLGHFVTELSTMLIIGLVFSVFGIGFFCWLLFILAVYALPFVAGLTGGFAAYHSGAGVAAAIIVAIIAGGVTLTIGQIAFATVRSPLIRAAIGLIYAVPAAIAGYNGTLGFAQMGIPSEAWRVTFAVIGAIAVGGTAWARMALFVPPEEGLGIAGSPAPHRLAGATRQG
jgi:hypothetical protein